jgi:DNA polymerase-3 subunit delta'
METFLPEAITDHLRTLVRSGSRQHAFLFSGPEHIGKFLLARRFANALAAKDGTLIDRDVSVSPEIMILVPETVTKDGSTREKGIEVDRIREMRRFVSLRGEEGRSRICVIDNAHMLTVAAQNALLKTLEEPPEGSVIILVTHRVGALLQTVLSRSREIRFSQPSSREFRRWLVAQVSEGADEWESLSLGRPGTVAKMLGDREEFSKRKKWLDSLRLLRTADANDLLALGEEMSKDASGCREMLRVWEYALRKEALEDPDAARRNYALIEKVEGMIELLLSTNANKRLLLEAFFLSCGTRL